VRLPLPVGGTLQENLTLDCFRAQYHWNPASFGAIDVLRNADLQWQEVDQILAARREAHFALAAR
jgi:hypothetical protein